MDLLKIAEETSQYLPSHQDNIDEINTINNEEIQINKHKLLKSPSNKLIDSISKVFISENYSDKGYKRKVFKAKKTAWVHNFLHLEGRKFDFSGREYLAQIYNSPSKRILLKTARQVEKTTFLANNITVMNMLLPNFSSLYVSPSHSQTQQFSNEKLKPLIEKSPLIAKYLFDNSVVNQVFYKEFLNGSRITLRSAFLTADRTRGISSKSVVIDEFQDIILNHIPVILECTSHYSDTYDYQMFAGTPKTIDNTIEVFWKQSTQNEWMVPCDCIVGDTGRCWNFLDEKNIHKTKRVVCKKCGKPLNVSLGIWCSASPGDKFKLEGYRIPQIMVPWIISTEPAWARLINKFETYPPAQFANEVLGLSFDNANKPITMIELQRCCKDHSIMDVFSPEIIRWAEGKELFAGIDWGEGHDGGKGPTGKIKNASYTVLTIGHYVSDDVFKIIYIKKFTGKEVDPDFIIEFCLKIFRNLNITYVGVDWGHGWGVNNQLFKKYNSKKIIQFMYIGNQKEKIVWDSIGYKMQISRNLIISEEFENYKKQQISLPKWLEFEPFSRDILGIYAEYSEYQRTLKYDHKASDPDDFFHSEIYCRLAADIFYGKIKR